MYSVHCNYTYDINVYIPTSPTPAEGFAVLFVLDGQRYSKMIYEAMENQLKISQKTKVTPMIIVSIGHQSEDAHERRFYDFTPPASQYEFPTRRGKKMPEIPVGNGETFKLFIELELLPWLNEHYDVNNSQYALFGHSLGGLYTLYLFLQYPNLFHRYVAVSPSIWWNNKQLLNLLVEKETAPTQPLAIYVGGDEGDMIDDASAFQKTMFSQKKQMDFYIAMNENHASVIPTTISRAFRFISKDSFKL